MNYHNENDPFAATWLEAVIAEGLIAPGLVDRRSIEDVHPSDLDGFAQCHFFAGIGGWPLALRMAGVSDDRPVWTGSCPCQPFSAAGKRKGVADARHLWPELHRLIANGQPPVVFGEQVASKDGRLWLAGVRTDLEALGYGVGAADLCAAGVGAPHIRQRLYWVADTTGSRCDGQEPRTESQARDEARMLVSRKCSTDGGLEHTNSPGEHQRAPGREQSLRYVDHEEYGGMERPDERTPWASNVGVPCADGKYRRIPANEAGEPEPALFPLAHGISNRMGALRGSGNAIVPALAAEFIRVFLECNG